MSEAEKWDWHAEVYAFRRIVLGIADDTRSSPCDPDGVWFDEPRVTMAAAKLRRKLQGGAERRRQTEDRTDAPEGRAAVNAWLRRAGFADLESWVAATGRHWTDAYVMCVGEIIARAPNLPDRDRNARGREVRVAAKEMGVTATEIPPHHLLDEDDPRVLGRLHQMGMLNRRNREYTPEEMAAARRELGLEPAGVAP